MWPLEVNIRRETVGVRSDVGWRIRWWHLVHAWGRPATRSEVEEQRSFLYATFVRRRMAGRGTIGPAIALVARCGSGGILACLRGSEVGGSRSLMRRFRARRMCNMSMILALSVWPRLSCGRRDETWAQRQCCFGKSVDVGRLANVPSVVVALRPRSCRGSSRGSLPARLRLQPIAKYIVCCRRVVVVGLEGAQLGDGRRQWLDVKSGRAWRATRPHISFGTLEVAVVARLGEHCCGGSGRAIDRGESEVVVWCVRRLEARRRRGEAVPLGTSRAYDSGRGHWRRREQYGQAVGVSRSSGGRERGYSRCRRSVMSAPLLLRRIHSRGGLKPARHAERADSR